MIENEETQHNPSYRWVIAVVCFLMMFVTMGFGNSPNGQYLGPVTKEFGLSRADFALTFSMRYLFTMTFNLLWGKLFLRMGAQKPSGLGILCLSGAFFLFSVSDRLPLFYLGGALQGMALAYCTTATCSSLVNSWFDENKGTVLGVVFAASGLGGAAGNFIVARWIAANGWRYSYRLTSLLILAAGLGLTLFIRARKGAAAAPAGKKQSKQPVWEGVPLEVLRKKAYFYVVFVIVFVLGWLCNPVYTIAPAHLVDRGYDPVFAGQITGILFAVLGVAKVLCGIMYDRWGLKPVFLLCSASGIAALLVLAWAQGTFAALLFAFLLGFAMPVETIIIPLLVMNLFGQKAYNSVVGVLIALMSGGIAFGNPLVNFLYGRLGSYTPALVSYTALFALCALLYLWCDAQASSLKKANAQ